MATAKATEDGLVTEDILNYYNEKSAGGHIGLIILEHNFIMLEGRAKESQLSIADDSTIEGLSKIAAVIHGNGSKCAVQINHAGSLAFGVDNTVAWGPSAVSFPGKSAVPQELSVQQIHDIIEAFRLAAIRAKKAGFDAVEIHSAHVYLLSQFYSPLTNKRTDGYGGDIYGRIRIHLEIIKAVREAVGDSFPILLRFGASDYLEGGSTTEESIIAAKEFEKAGVNILDISGGFIGYIHPTCQEPGWFLDSCAPIKEAIHIPVVLTGGVTSLEQADKLLSAGGTDLVGIGRAIFKNSNLASGLAK